MSTPDDPRNLSPDEPNTWDERIAKDLPGKRLLIGLTFLSRDGALLGMEQLFGCVTAVDRRSGISLTLEGTRAGETYRLPPDTRALSPAPPGQYRLRGTGEVVENPAFLVTFEVVRPQRH